MIKNEEAKKTEDEKVIKAIRSLDDCYFDLMTQPYSINRMRYSKSMFTYALNVLDDVLGKEKAEEELKKIKNKYAPSLGSEQKIHYNGILDKIKDTIVTKIKDFFNFD